MFEKLRHWLDANGYCWYRTHISGRIQEIVEQNFMLYTMRLGVPEAYLKYTNTPFIFTSFCAGFLQTTTTGYLVQNRMAELGKV